MVIVFSILGLILVVLIIGKINLSIKFRKQVKELFYLSKSISQQQFHKSQIDGLPEPVQRYFNYILTDGQPLKFFGDWKRAISVMQNFTSPKLSMTIL